MKTANTNEKILAILAASASGVSAAQLANQIKLSPSRTREILAKLLKTGKVQRQADGDGRTQVYSVEAPAKKADGKGDGKADGKLDGKTPKATKAARLPKMRIKGAILPTSGKGHPGAKKVVNPQPTLELKKQAVRQAKGRMQWVNRKWHIEANGKEVEVQSRELAKMTIGDLCKSLGISLPSSPSTSATA